MVMINNYLESIFATLPNTAEVRRAKDELGQMMEDKYAELISQGVSENEALAKVISEFGNIDEMAVDLGLDMALVKRNADGRFMIDMDVAKDYILDANTFALRISLGVALMILCPIMPILAGSGAMSMGLGLSGMFMLIFGGIFLTILGGSHQSRWKFVRKRNCTMDYQTFQFVKHESNKQNATYALRLTLGIMLCSVCWLPLVLLSENHGILARLMGSSSVFGVVVLFVMVAFGVMLIIDSSILKGLYYKLLKVNDERTIAGNYGTNNQSIGYGQPSGYGQPGMNGQPAYGYKKAEKYTELGKTIMASFWPGVTCIYLVYSFLTMAWATSWLIWPIAAFVYPVLSSIFKIKE